MDKYKQAVLKDYKRITLYLCTVNDIEEFRKEERDSDSSESEASGSVKRSNESDACIATEPPAKKLTTNHPTNDHAGPSGISTNSGSDSWFYYDEIERLYGNDDSPPPSNNKKKSPISESEANVIELLQEKVISDGKISMFIIIRRGTPVTRAITLWQRAAKKVNPVHVCRVKFVGEDGIDDGALAREFFSCIIPDIAKNSSQMEVLPILQMTLPLIEPLGKLLQLVWAREAQPQTFWPPVCLTLWCHLEILTTPTAKIFKNI